MYIFVSYLIILIYMFRIIEELKKYSTNEELLANSPWYYSFGAATDNYYKIHKPKISDTSVYYFMVALAPISVAILSLVLLANVSYNLIFKWIPKLFKNKTVQQ